MNNHYKIPWTTQPFSGPVPLLRFFSVTAGTGHLHTKFVAAVGGENAEQTQHTALFITHAANNHEILLQLTKNAITLAKENKPLPPEWLQQAQDALITADSPALAIQHLLNE
jgi:hypothetical protein